MIKVVRVDGEVIQDPGGIGGDLDFNFVAEGKVLTIDAKGAKLPYYEQAGSYPPQGANWVGVAIPVPLDVDTTGVYAEINGKPCSNLYFDTVDGKLKYIEYISVETGDLQDGKASYTWVIRWGSGYGSETINIELINVDGLASPVPEA
ncbi:MAG TPA: hypothetical protein GX699_08595 [Firmicutes bacterium]|nr:hypothetical protein [Bacillota bacterium]